MGKYIYKALDASGKIIRGKLKSEFDLELRKKVLIHEEELKRDKLNLEIEIQNKMKQMLR